VHQSEEEAVDLVLSRPKTPACSKSTFLDIVETLRILLPKSATRVASKRTASGREYGILCRRHRILASHGAGSAPALQVSRANHTSAASGVAYADTCGEIDLLNATDVGRKALHESLRWHKFLGGSFRTHPNGDCAWVPRLKCEFQFVAALRTQLTSREWRLVAGPSASGSIVAARLHPHHQQGYIVALRLSVRERGDLVQDRIDDLLRTLAAARL
jgi:hypothetical protein